MREQARGVSPDEALRRLSALNAHAREREEHARRAEILGGIALALLLLGFSAVVWGGFLRIPQFNPRSQPQGPAAPERSHPTSVAEPQTPPASRIRSSVPASPPVTGVTLTGGTRGRTRGAPARQKQRRAITFRFSAVRGDCWATIRARSASGRVLYQGLLRQGKSASVSGRLLWARFGAIGNLDMFLNGRRVTASHTGTVDAVVTGSGLSP